MTAKPCNVTYDKSLEGGDGYSDVYTDGDGNEYVFKDGELSRISQLPT